MDSWSSEINYSFEAKLWRSAGAGGWHFVSLPESLADHIRNAHGSSESGWGRLKVTAKLCSDSWSTSIWFDTKYQTYLLPVNAKIRNKYKLNVDDLLQVNLVPDDGLF